MKNLSHEIARRLEWYTAEVFREKGWSIKPKTIDEVGTWRVEGVITSDQVDVYGEKQDDEGETIYLFVECKAYDPKRKRAVGKKEMQKFAHTIENLKYKFGLSRMRLYFVTTSYFTRDAKKIAESYGIRLIEGSELRDFLGKKRYKELQELLKLAEEECVKDEKHGKLKKSDDNERIEVRIRHVTTKFIPNETQLIQLIDKQLQYNRSRLNINLTNIFVEYKRLEYIYKETSVVADIPGKGLHEIIVDKKDSSLPEAPMYLSTKIIEDEIIKRMKIEEIFEHSDIVTFQKELYSLMQKLFKDEVRKIESKIYKKYKKVKLDFLEKEISSLREKADKLEGTLSSLETEINEIESEIEEREEEGRPTKRLKQKLRALQKEYREKRKEYDSILNKISKKESKLEELKQKIQEELNLELQNFYSEKASLIKISKVDILYHHIEYPESIRVSINVIDNDTGKTSNLDIYLSLDDKLNIINNLNNLYICTDCLKLYDINDIHKCSNCGTYVCRFCKKETKKLILFKKVLCDKCFRSTK